MTDRGGLSRPEFYRQLAQWLRERANGYDLDEVKARLESVAKAYEAYAEEVERRLLGR